MEDKNRVHLKIDEVIFNLLKDYHNVTPIEAVTFFKDMAYDMLQVEGNIANRTVARVNRGRGWQTIKKENEKPEDTEKHRNIHNNLFGTYRGARPSFDYDAYCLRGYYPGSNVPFKMTGLNIPGQNTKCFVIALGNTNKIPAKFNVKKISELDQAVADAILLDESPDKLLPDFHKVKSFRCQRPKGLPLLKKAANDKKKKENNKKS